MDIFACINSKDIRKYLKQIGYKFDSLETAWLIYACKALSYEDKKALWKEVIMTMPDCVVPSRMNCAGWESLHGLLEKYIDITDHEIADFYDQKTDITYVYMYSYLYKGDEEWTEEFETIYPSLDKCLEAYRNDVEDLDEEYASEKETGVIRYRLKRQSLVDTDDVMEIESFGNGQLKNIIRDTNRTEEEYTVLQESFDGLWFDFPTPFKKGDVVWVPKDARNIIRDCEGAFVLSGLVTWNTPEHIRKSGDITDMNGYGYFLNNDGTVYHEVMCNYMDLEYYTGSYKLNERILPVLSKFMKGEIEVDLLLSAYRKILLDVAAADIMLKSWYSDEVLKELGLK